MADGITVRIIGPDLAMLATMLMQKLLPLLKRTWIG